MQFFFRNLDGRCVTAELAETFTLDQFLKTAGRVLGHRDREVTLLFRYTVSGKSLNVVNEKEFDQKKGLITAGCNIFVLGRLLGGWCFSDTLQAIAEQQLPSELRKATTSSSDCAICLDNATECIRICCVWVCRDDLQRWLLEKHFKVSCTVCSKAIKLGDIFKSSEYIATLQAVEEERDLLRNMDVQRCLVCNALMHNETMYTRQTCVRCHRVFCFFCNRDWNATAMLDRQNSCGKECLYEAMVSFRLVPFHYNSDIKIPSERTCPQCFNFGAYDGKCKYHTCTICHLTFCFLCLEKESECKRKYKSSYDKVCVRPPAAQNYSMFPRLMSPED